MRSIDIQFQMFEGGFKRSVLFAQKSRTNILAEIKNHASRTCLSIHLNCLHNHLGLFYLVKRNTYSQNIEQQFCVHFSMIILSIKKICVNYNYGPSSS